MNATTEARKLDDGWKPGFGDDYFEQIIIVTNAYNIVIFLQNTYEIITLFSIAVS